MTQNRVHWSRDVSLPSRSRAQRIREADVHSILPYRQTLMPLSELAGVDLHLPSPAGATSEDY